MNVITFISENWGLLLLAAAAIVAVTVAVADAFKGNKSVVMNMLYALVTEAEKQYGNGTGALKLAAVISQVYPKLPAIIKTFVSIEMLTGWVEDALEAAKAEWEKNVNLANYINEKDA